MKNKIAIAYIPVLHKGYFDFLAELKKKEIKKLYLTGDFILESCEELDYLNRKDRLRAVDISRIQKMLESISDLTVYELNAEAIEKIRDEEYIIVTPNEDIGHVVAENYFENNNVEYVDIFLRWHRDNTAEQKAVKADREVSQNDFDKEMMTGAIAESKKSFDWWRQIGAVLTKKSEPILIAHNTHMPDEQSPNVFGDPRAVSKKGIDINISTAAHAEEIIIAEAARRGIVLEGTAIYVTEFPCPYCARLISRSGIKKVFFQKGYAVLDGDNFLKEEGIEVVRVEM